MAVGRGPGGGWGRPKATSPEKGLRSELRRGSRPFGTSKHDWNGRGVRMMGSVAIWGGCPWGGSGVGISMELLDRERGSDPEDRADGSHSGDVKSPGMP